MKTERVGPEDWDQAVADVSGPQLVVAGPGTGKTEFLVRRAIHLIGTVGVPADQILMLTFSRRAAAELRARVGAGLGHRVAGLDASTFHSFAHRFLEAHGDETPTLLTGPEQIRLVAELLADEDPDSWPLPFRPLLRSPSFAEEVADFLLRCRERLLGPEELAGFGREDWRAIPGFFTRYVTELRSAGRVDYGTLLVDATELLAKPEVAASVAGRHRYVLVDEYQDTSPAQAKLLDLLTAEHRNITVAGDPYQSIYSFRGAELRNVADFATRFTALAGAPARRLVLSTSFRVPAEIIAAALRVTSSGDLPGAAGPVDPAPHAGRVDAHVFDQASAEAEWIASEIERLLVEERLSPDRIAVLLRSKRHFLPELSRALDRRRIPHEEPDTRLVDHPAVRAVLDLARAVTITELLASGEPSPGLHEALDRVLRRVLLGPLYRLPVAVERELVRSRQRDGRSWTGVLADHDEASDLVTLLTDGSWATQRPAIDGFWHVWQTLAVFDDIALDPARVSDREALAAFSQALGRQAERDAELTLAEYLELADTDDFEATPLLTTRRRSGLLTLTTLHQAKGLEFDVVFIADASEGIFPDTRRSRALLQPHLLARERIEDPAALVRFRLQEEMRLAYTAITRARSRVVLTATSAGVDEGERRPSRFLLAAAGVMATDELAPPAPRTGPPVSVLELETSLRRLAADPTGPAARRLAAIRVLVEPPGSPPWDVTRFAGVAQPGPDTHVVELPTRLSPSQAEAYEQCPRRYVFERRLSLLEAGSPYMAFGILVHAVLERAERKAMAGGRSHSSFDEAVVSLDELIDTTDFGSPVLRRAWYERATKLLDRLYREWPADSKAPIALERPLTLDVDGTTWLGRADRIERTATGGIRIVDYKTGSTIPTIAQAATSLQLGFYALAAIADPELDTDAGVEAELWHPLSSSVSWRRSFDPDNLATVRERLSAAAAGILGENWAARAGAHCARCGVRLVCDRWPEGREAFVG